MLPSSIDLFGTRIPDSVYMPVGSLLFIIVWMSLGLSLKALIFSRFKAWADKTETKVDDLLIAALNLPVVLLLFCIGLLILIRIGVSTQYISHDQLYHVLLVIGVISVIIFADRLLRGAIVTYADKVEVFRVAGGLVQSTVRAIVLVVGVLVMLGTLGINITPVIASLGVGSLAVALALQPTLENFFAGIQVISDRQIMEGQFVRLESGEEGFVYKINMRSTWLRTSLGNMLVFPNKLLVTTRIMNYHYPNRELDVPVPLSVHYDSDLEKVERVVGQEALALQKEFQGAVKTHEPLLRFTVLADSGVTCNVSLRVEDVTFQGAIRHAFIKRIIARFRAEGIIMPYPTRAIQITQGGLRLPDSNAAAS